MTAEAILKKVNGSGWLVHLIYTTVLIVSFYWQIHEQIAVLQKSLEAANQHTEDLFKESAADRAILHEDVVQLQAVDAETRTMIFRAVGHVR